VIVIPVEGVEEGSTVVADLQEPEVPEMAQSIGNAERTQADDGSTGGEESASPHLPADLHSRSPAKPGTPWRWSFHGEPFADDDVEEAEACRAVDTDMSEEGESLF
jgi:hypothetical protein